MENVIIYHQGHSGGFINGKNTLLINFVNSGFSVAAFSMPLIWIKQPTYYCAIRKSWTMLKFFKHNQFVLLDSDDFSSL